MTEETPTGRSTPFRFRRRRPSDLVELADCLRDAVDPETDWYRVIATANRHLVGPQLYRSLRDSASAARVDPEVMAYLADMDAANCERNRRLHAQLVEVSAAFGAAGLVPVALKGAAILARGHAPEASPRMLRDLDILVPGRDAAKADEILRGIGYAPFEGSASSHSSGSYYRKDAVGAVDVHTRLPRRFRQIVSAGDLENRTRSLTIGDSVIRVPDASLHFVINIAHDMLHDQGVLFGFLDLRYLLELVALCADSSDPLDWPWIDGKCASFRFRLALELQSRMARHLGASSFPKGRTTALGRLLHERRLFNERHTAIGVLQWSAVRWVKRLRRAALAGR